MVRFDSHLGERYALKNACALLAATLACSSSYAQVAPPVPLDTVVVSATRDKIPAFDAPAAIGVVEGEAIRSAGPMVNLSESLARVPGISVLNRQNYSQDLQLSVRGFGSRSTFGIRGVRLIIDGIPATMPDGQGQASSVSLSSAARIEVLRGPLALLYGNAAGGVVQVFSEVGSERPIVTFGAAAGPYDMGRYDIQFSGSSGPHGYTVDVSRFSTDGYRDHSAASRDQLNAKWRWQWSEATRIDTVVNVLDQPLALDPLGLTRAQWEDNPRQSPAIAAQQDAHKTVKQRQAGTVLEHRFDADTTFVARVYIGERVLDNALSIPLAAQLPPSSSGGMVDFDRHYAGAGVQLQRRFALTDFAVGHVLAGYDFDRMLDVRQGYLNNNGVRGALRRDEDDKVANSDALLQAGVDLGESWSAIAGVRSSRVRFETTDRYIAPGNPDDSGELIFRATNPVAGVTWHASPALNVYANAGRGFETPTFTELAYRNVGSGINTDLKASRSRHLELGAKWRLAHDHALEAALFDVHTRDEIVVDTNVGGRSTFRNAGPTARRGAEFSYTGRWFADWRTTLSLTALRARFDENIVSGSGASGVVIARGNRLPGTPERSAFAEVVYAPRAAWAGFNAAAEVVHVGRLYVNDANDDSAPAVTYLNLRTGFKQSIEGLEIEPLLRLENATNRRYAGSVIVNESNRRFFEPAPRRGWMASITARYRF